MNREEIIEKEKLHMAGLYWKRPVVLYRGRGALLWDVNGKEYVDCTSNYGVAVTGHCHPKVVEAIKTQTGRLLSSHGTFYNEQRSELLEKLMTWTPKSLDKAFLSNSGAEAVEFALKLARRSTGKSDIVAMMGAFHGKSFGALSATWNRKYRTPFEPLVPGFRHVPFGNVEAFEKVLDEKVAAVITEPIQGESGINVPPQDYLPRIREICDSKDVLLILDEVQTGMGRTGKMFAFEHSHIQPDILCLAKGIASGIPMGVTIARGDLMSSLASGEHTNTFGGGPIACAAANATLDVIREERLVERAAQLGSSFVEKLRALKENRKIIRDVRGLGLMVGVELRFDILNVLLRSMEKGVLILDAGRNILRFLPPLVIQQKQLEKVVTVLDEVIGQEESAKLHA